MTTLFSLLIGRLCVPLVVCAFLQATSKNYKVYAERLASWGFAVLQYDFDRMSPWIDQLCHSDAAEVRGCLLHTSVLFTQM